MDSWEHGWPLANCNFSQVTAVALAIQRGTAIAVSDGSYMPKRSTAVASAAFKLLDTVTGECCEGQTLVSGTEKEVNAYRAELQGIHADLLLILAVCSFFEIRQGSAQVYCDNEKGIMLSSKNWLQLALKTKHVDLIRAIHKLVKEIPIDIGFTHVYGHQDDASSTLHLDLPTRINIEMDYKAKLYLRSELDRLDGSICPQEIEREGWRCWVGDVKLTTDPATTIRRSCPPPGAV